MSTENPLGMPIPMGVITADDNLAHTEVAAIEQDSVAEDNPLFDTLWLAPMKIGLATTVTVAALSLNPFFALSVLQPAHSPA